MLPNQLKFQGKIESASAKSYKTNLQPQNGTSYTIGNGQSNILYFNIPTGNNLLLCSSESYLRFDVTYTNTSGANSSFRWDACGCHSIFSRIRVYSGSNLVEDIDSYGNLAKMLMAVQINAPSNKTKWNILAGTRNDYITGVTTGAAFVGNTTTISSIINQQSGEMLTPAAQYGQNGTLLTPNWGAIANNGTSTSRTYCLNLISVIGSLCQSKYFPLFACGSAPLRVELWMNDQLSKMACVTSDNGTLTLNNVEFVAHMLELNDTGMEIIRQSLNNNPLQFVIPSYRNYQFTTPQLGAGQNIINMPIPAKFSSLKSIFCSIRDKGTNTPTFFPYSSVTGGTFNNYYFRIGSLILPPKFPYNTTEAYAELAKAISSISDINYLANVDQPYYIMSTSTAPSDVGLNNSGSGCFFLGLDCENYPNASKSDIFAGMNTNNSDIYLAYTFTAAGNITLRFDAYALFDQLLIFENNTCYVKF